MDNTEKQRSYSSSFTLPVSTELEKGDAALLSSAVTLPGTSSISLPEHCFQSPETVQTLLQCWSNVMIAKEQSKASVVASTCGLLTAKLKSKAYTTTAQVSACKDVLVNRTSERNMTERKRIESETTREVSRMQQEENILSAQKTPWQNFTNACTIAFGLHTFRSLAKSGVRFPQGPGRAIGMLFYLVIFYLMSRHPFFRKYLVRLMLWRHPRFQRAEGCSVSFDGRKITFSKDDAESKIHRPFNSPSKTPLQLNFIGRRFRVGCTDGARYWMVEAPINGKLAVCDSPDASIDIGNPKEWGIILDTESRMMYLTAERKILKMVYSNASITSPAVWPVIIGLAGEEVELVW